MKSNKKLKHLIDLHFHMEYYNIMSPFPIYDTELVEFIKNKITKMANEDKVNYDEESVVACKYCNNLAIEVDEEDNDICLKCGSTNELKTYNNIHDYLRYINELKNE